MKEYIVQAIAQETIDSFDAHNAPELIRCKDCKNKEKDGISEGFHYCNINGLQVTDDWYCADGERRDDDALDNSKRRTAKRNKV